jgi:hypothetical protein
MKKNFIVLFISFFSVLNLYAQSADEASIKKVCEAETRTWLDGDKAGHAACWNVQSYSTAMISLPDGTFITASGNELMATEDKAMGGGGSFTNTNYVIRISGNTAWATFDQSGADTKGNKKTSKELRILEKVNGEWKIVVMDAHLYAPK